MAGAPNGPDAEVPPSGGLPDFGVTRGTTALMIIDVQYVDADRDHGLGAAGKESGWTEEIEQYFSRLETLTIPNIRRLLDACRDAGVPPIHVRIMSLAGDCSDTSARYKLFGILVPPGSKDSEFIPDVAPIDGEVVINKTTSSVFMGTNADFVLRNMGVDTLIVAGVLTNKCVESSVRNAADLGYSVLLVEDACAAWTQDGHDLCVRHLDRNFALVRSTEQILAEIAALAPSRHHAVAV
jgi:nicotinamidase-related amidase